jgi:surfactin synthase thioesterase subunit
MSMTLERSPESRRWVRASHRPSPGAVRVACLPHAGGAAASFKDLSDALAPRIELLAIQYPGRQERYHEPLIESVEAYADRLADVLGEWTDRPLAIFGHSLGAAIGFEVARRLEDRGVALAGLFVSSHAVQTAPRPGPIHTRDDQGLIAALLELGGAGSELLRDPSFSELILPVVRADLKASESYACRIDRPLRTDIRALVGDHDPRVGPAEMERWRDRTRGSFALEVFPGGHFYMADHLAAVAALIEAQLAPVGAFDAAAAS